MCIRFNPLPSTQLSFTSVPTPSPAPASSSAPAEPPEVETPTPLAITFDTPSAPESVRFADMEPVLSFPENFMQQAQTHTTDIPSVSRLRAFAQDDSQVNQLTFSDVGFEGDPQGTQSRAAEVTFDYEANERTHLMAGFATRDEELTAGVGLNYHLEEGSGGDSERFALAAGFASEVATSEAQHTDRAGFQIDRSTTGGLTQNNFALAVESQQSQTTTAENGANLQEETQGFGYDAAYSVQETYGHEDPAQNGTVQRLQWGANLSDRTETTQSDHTTQSTEIFDTAVELGFSHIEASHPAAETPLSTQSHAFISGTVNTSFEETRVDDSTPHLSYGEENESNLSYHMDHSTADAVTTNTFGFALDGRQSDTTTTVEGQTTRTENTTFGYEGSYTLENIQGNEDPARDGSVRNLELGLIASEHSETVRDGSHPSTESFDAAVELGFSHTEASHPAAEMPLSTQSHAFISGTVKASFEETRVDDSNPHLSYGEENESNLSYHMNHSTADAVTTNTFGFALDGRQSDTTTTVEGQTTHTENTTFSYDGSYTLEDTQGNEDPTQNGTLRNVELELNVSHRDETQTTGPQSESGEVFASELALNFAQRDQDMEAGATASETHFAIEAGLDYASESSVTAQNVTEFESLSAGFDAGYSYTLGEGLDGEMTDSESAFVGINVNYVHESTDNSVPGEQSTQRVELSADLRYEEDTDHIANTDANTLTLETSMAVEGSQSTGQPQPLAEGAASETVDSDVPAFVDPSYSDYALELTTHHSQYESSDGRFENREEYTLRGEMGLGSSPLSTNFNAFFELGLTTLDTNDPGQIQFGSTLRSRELGISYHNGTEQFSFSFLDDGEDLVGKLDYSVQNPRLGSEFDFSADTDGNFSALYEISSF